MEQRRFWPRRSPKRVKKIALSERGIYEPVEKEENVLDAVVTYLWRCGIPVFRVQERVPTCWNCHAKVCKPSAAGHPDLHGYVPIQSMIRWARSEPVREWLKQNLRYPVPFFIEMKRAKGGRHRPAQTEFILRLTDDKVPSCFARSVAEVRAMFHTADVLLPEPNSYTMEAPPQ